MKKHVLLFAVIAALAASCQKADLNTSEGAYKFDFTFAAGGFGDTKSDATVGWTEGEKVFVFFQPAGGSLLGNSYAEFTYNGNGWTPDSYVAPGALGASGVMAAVYVPYLGDKSPVFSGDSWTIDGGDVYYACASGAAYTVEGSTVAGTLQLAIPDGYVQFAVNPVSAEEGDVMACNYVDAYTCVTLSTDLTFSATAEPDKKMTGHADNGKVYFWGMFNGCTDDECEWVLTNKSGDMVLKVPADKVTKNTSYILTSMPAGAPDIFSTQHEGFGEGNLDW